MTKDNRTLREELELAIDRSCSTSGSTSGPNSLIRIGQCIFHILHRPELQRTGMSPSAVASACDAEPWAATGTTTTGHGACSAHARATDPTRSS